MLCRIEPCLALYAGDHVGECRIVADTADDGPSGASVAVADIGGNACDWLFVDDCGPHHLEHRGGGTRPFGRPVALPRLVVPHRYSESMRPVPFVRASVDALELDGP